MATKAELAKQYIALQRASKTDEMVAMLADDVEMTVPMQGTTSGKAAVEQAMRSRPGGGGAENLTWEEPTEQDGLIQMVATGGPFGPVRLMLGFNADEKVNKIEIALGGAAKANGESMGTNQFGFQPPPLNMSWAKVPTERPPKPKDLGPEGFTLKKADAGGYAWSPDYWPYRNDTPRGAWPAPEDRRGLSAPYTIYDKHEVWAESAADLYEIAIQSRWIPATEISWGSIEPVEEHVEASLDQIFTMISETQYNSNQMLMGWLTEISYGYHEVKLYLSTQVFEQARHVEAFRKRALSNGGGLGVQTPGFMNRTVYSAFKFTELVVYINIIRASFLLGLCEQGDKLARSQADRQLFENTANDLRRHITFGVDHLKYFMRHSTSNVPHIETWLNRGEAMLSADLKRDKPLREAFILALGDTVEQGKANLKELRQAQLQRYLTTLKSASIYNRDEKVIPALRDVIENP
jgi:hypothetical protein